MGERKSPTNILLLGVLTMDYRVYVEMLEAFNEAHIVDFPCAESEEDFCDAEPWDLIDEMDSDLEIGFDPYLGDYSWDC